ncbi:MAG: lysoplasmalogenase [Treponema sp.]|jgi:uncharacterized membrane protein YhhN|nr:lysoplasmalogenase [Treponema sp.]
MEMIFLTVFAVAAPVYLASLFCRRGVFQSIGKACLMPLVLAVYITGANRFFFPVALALVFGWLGDILLLKINDFRFFRLGLASFLLGHLCYVFTMFYFAETVEIPALVISLAAAIPLGIGMYILVRPNREMRIPVMVYEAVILFMAAAAVQFCIARGPSSGALVLAGSLSFLVSDSLLAFFTFRGAPCFGSFAVMLTYLTAQFCITLGLCVA